MENWKDYDGVDYSKRLVVKTTTLLEELESQSDSNLIDLLKSLDGCTVVDDLPF